MKSYNKRIDEKFHRKNKTIPLITENTKAGTATDFFDVPAFSGFFDSFDSFDCGAGANGASKKAAHAVTNSFLVGSWSAADVFSLG